MKNFKELFKSKKSIIAIIILVVILIVAVYFEINFQIFLKSNYIPAEEISAKPQNDIQSGEEETLNYKQLSEKKYEIDYDNNKITISNDVNALSVCISESSNGPTSSDKWINVDGTKTFEVDDDLEETKVYVYYLARVVSTVSEFNEEASVYIIRSLDELNAFATKVNNGDTFTGKTVYLMENITLPANFVSIGTAQHPFAGTFNGNGYKITTNFDSTSSYVSIFKYVENAIIKNIDADGEINTSIDNAASIVENGSGIISNCKNYATITSTGKNTAGIVSTFIGTIENCMNLGNITGTENVGGIASYLPGGCKIYNCKNEGDITSTGNYIGGISSYVAGVEIDGENTFIKYSVNNGKINGGGMYSGGIVGYTEVVENTASVLYYNEEESDLATMSTDIVRIENCKNIGNVEAASRLTGGIAGSTHYTYIANCLNEGDVTSGGYYAGGIVGAAGYDGDSAKNFIIYCRNSGTILNYKLGGGIVGSTFGVGKTQATANQICFCANSGAITTTVLNSNAQSKGGIAGSASNIRIRYCYNIANISGGRYVGGICGAFRGAGDNVTMYIEVEYCYSNATISAYYSATASGIANWRDTKDFNIKRYCYAAGTYDEVYRRYTGDGNRKSSSTSNYSNISTYSNFYIDSNNVNNGKGWILAMDVNARILHHPQSYINPTTSTITLETIASGTNLTYQWYKIAEKDLGLDYESQVTQEIISQNTGTLITGATQSTYVAPVTDERIWYYCIVNGKKVTGRNSSTYAATTASTTIRTNAGLIGPGEDVVIAPVLMERENTYYIIGAKRQNEKTGDADYLNYTSDKVKKIYIRNIQVDEVPTSYVAMWDASQSSDTGVKLYLTTSTQDSEKYDVWLYGLGQIALPENSNDLFARYMNLTEIDGIENVITSSVTTMCYMFEGCENLTSLDVSNFDTSKVTDMSYMFDYCEALTSLDVSGFDTSKITDMSYMFEWCEALTSLDVSNFDTSEVTGMGGMFFGCEALTSLDVSNFDTSKVTGMGGMFSGCEALTSLDVSRFDTSKVTEMNAMFSYCGNLTSLDVSGFDTSKITDMSYMFEWCEALTSLDVSRFDTSKVTGMGGMFSGCEALTSLDVSRFDTSKVTEMNVMFSYCSNLTNLDVSNFDTSKVTGMSYMFANCTSLTALNLSNFELVSGNVNKTSMFAEMTSLKSIALGKDFGNLDGENMFSGCNKLEAIIIQKAIADTSSIPSLIENTGLENIANVKLYVLDETAQNILKQNDNYSTIFGEENIKEILEIVGNNPTNVGLNGNYEDAGATVSGYNYSEAEMYTVYGYYLEVMGLPVDTTQTSVQEVIYTLKFAE